MGQHRHRFWVRNLASDNACAQSKSTSYRYSSRLTISCISFDGNTQCVRVYPSRHRPMRRRETQICTLVCHHDPCGSSRLLAARASCPRAHRGPAGPLPHRHSVRQPGRPQQPDRHIPQHRRRVRVCASGVAVTCRHCHCRAQGQEAVATAAPWGRVDVLRLHSRPLRGGRRRAETVVQSAGLREVVGTLLRGTEGVPARERRRGGSGWLAGGKVALWNLRRLIWPSRVSWIAKILCFRAKKVGVGYCSVQWRWSDFRL